MTAHVKMAASPERSHVLPRNIMLRSALKLCLVTHQNQPSFNDYKQYIQQAIKGGVTSIQLRDKTLPITALRNTAIALLDLLRPLSIPLIINDNATLAKEIDAEGVHLGQSDQSPVDVRDMLGPKKIIGWSIETLEQLEQANELDCIDYIAASAIFNSNSKKDCKTIWGLTGLKQITQRSRHPVVAIGGINAGNIRDVILHGACGTAVISAIHDHKNPELAASELIRNMQEG